MIEDMPFCLGAMPTPANPDGLPSVYPFQIEINYKLGRIEQKESTELNGLLEQAYRVGVEMGTPSDDTELGCPYVEDFMQFITKYGKAKGQLLEIGAGTGFLSKCLLEKGWEVTSVEPGIGYKKHWERHGIPVVNDFFPTDEITGQFDAIVFYTVLEHIKNIKAFLESVKRQLKPKARVFLAVPDCNVEIANSDPSILLHEHFHYFDSTSLANTLISSGLKPIVESSSFGRSLFAVATQDSDLPPLESHIFNKKLEDFIAGVSKTRKIVNCKLKEWSELGTVGIYCPSRILNLISVGQPIIFYDDSISLRNKYYPPFAYKILSRKQLYNNPPKTLLIASRTFGSKLKIDLKEGNLSSNIYLLDDLI